MNLTKGFVRFICLYVLLHKVDPGINSVNPGTTPFTSKLTLFSYVEKSIILGYTISVCLCLGVGVNMNFKFV